MMRKRIVTRKFLATFAVCLVAVGALPAAQPRAGSPYDVIIRGGQIYDGSGSSPYAGDIAFRGDKVVALGALADAQAKHEIDAAGLAVAPGFINMLSWANESLIEDGRAQSDIRQGVTLEVLGEGNSMGPLNDAMKKALVADQGEIKYDVEWTTLDEYLQFLVRRGVSVNVASFVGNATVRKHVIGSENRPPTSKELAEMRRLVREAMEDGAVGMSSALIYVPSCFAGPEELTALAEVVADCGGMYISHVRNEGDGLLEAVDELLAVARKTGVRVEIYHLKAAGKANHDKLDPLIAKIEKARAEGLHITADMYTYAASASGLSITMPPWVHEGGQSARARRLQDPAIRRRVREAMLTPSSEWENTYLGVGSPEGILLTSFKNPALRSLTGKTLAQVAALRGTHPTETAMDLIVEDGSRVGAVFFSMSEENVRKKIALPWVSFCSDAGAPAAEGVFLTSNPHPRAYGSFARLLGKYVRDEGIISLEEAIQRLTSLPAENLRLDRRGALKPGHYADVVVFDPATIRDRATFTEPHQYATGVVHVFVNGVQVVRDGNHTGAKPGRVVRGPGWRKRAGSSRK